MGKTDLDAIPIYRGSTIELEIIFGGEAEPMDLTGDTVAIDETSDTPLDGLAVTIADARAGLVRIEGDETISKALPFGRRNWFRIKLTGETGDTETTPRIWLEVL